MSQIDIKPKFYLEPYTTPQGNKRYILIDTRFVPTGERRVNLNLDDMDYLQKLFAQVLRNESKKKPDSFLTKILKTLSKKRG